MVFPSKFFLPGSPRIQGGRESSGGEENSGHAQGPLSEVGLRGSKAALAGGGIESEIFSGSCAVWGMVGHQGPSMDTFDNFSTPEVWTHELIGSSSFCLLLFRFSPKCEIFVSFMSICCSSLLPSTSVLEIFSFQSLPSRFFLSSEALPCLFLKFQQFSSLSLSFFCAAEHNSFPLTSWHLEILCFLSNNRFADT